MVKYIIPVFMALLVFFAFAFGAIVRADAIVVETIMAVTVLLAPVLFDWGVTGLLNEIVSSSNPQSEYNSFSGQLPDVEICNNGVVYPLYLYSVRDSSHGLATNWGDDGDPLTTSDYGDRYLADVSSYLGTPITYTYYSAAVFPGYKSFKILSAPYGTFDGGTVSNLYDGSLVLYTSGTFTGQFPSTGIAYAYLPFASAPNTTKTITVNNSYTRTAQQIYNDPTTRLGSIAGNYLYLHSDFNAETKPDAYDTYLNTALVDETTMTYNNPVTGVSKTITDWQYNYANMSYSLTFSDGTSAAVTWGNEYCSIIENGTTYCLYYLPADWTPECKHLHTTTVTTGATCTVPGSTVVTCSDCGEVVSTTVIPALGHDDTAVDKSSASCADAGERQLTCSRCGRVKFEPIPALGHDWLLVYHVDGEQAASDVDTYISWAQPVLTSDTDYGTVSAGSYNGNGNAPAWRALDGQKSAGGQSWEAAQGVYPAWWQWKLPVTLKMSHLKLTNKYSGSSYVTKSVSVYSDSAHTNLIASGDFPNSSLSVLEWDFTDPVITDTLYIVCEDSHNSASNTYVGLGEVEITAQERVTQAGVVESGGYDLYRCSRCGEEYRDYAGTGPDENTGSSGFFKGLGNLIKRAISWVLDKLASLVEGLNSITDVFKGFIEEIKGFTTGFTEFISGVIGVLPAQLVTLLWFSVIAAVVLAVVSRFFR